MLVQSRFGEGVQYALDAAVLFVAITPSRTQSVQADPKREIARYNRWADEKKNDCS